MKKQCKNCKWWFTDWPEHPYVDDGWGSCMAVHDNEFSLQRICTVNDDGVFSELGLDENIALQTHGWFGCIQFEEKEDE